MSWGEFISPTEEAAMSVVRMIYVKVKPETTAEAERIWKQECDPLMIR